MNVSHVISSTRTTGNAGDRILRYTLGERINHWIAGLSYLYCLITGLAFWSPYLFWMAVIAGGGPAGNQRLRLAPVVDGLTLPRIQLG